MALYLRGASNATTEAVFAQIPVPSMSAGRSVAVTTSSQNIPLSVGADTLIITNTSTEVVYFKFGNSSVTASMGDLDWQFIVAGTDRRAVGVPPGATHLAYIGTAACSIYIEQY